jgi:beta-lactamase superfamily II metal-dependent hydrolase
MKTVPAFILLLSLLLAAPLPALSETVTYTCQYETYSDGKGLQKVADDFKLVFIIDTSKQTAQLVTNRGKFNVEMLPAPNEGLTLVEMIDGGKVLATSIDKDGKSVHSRNIILEGHISPSQYYGACSKR